MRRGSKQASGVYGSVLPEWDVSYRVEWPPAVSPLALLAGAVLTG